MHQIILCIVYAEDEEEALERAKKIFDEVINEGEYDYYSTFDDTMAVQRWGKIKPVMEIMEKEAIELLNEIWEAYIDDLKRALTNIKTSLNKNSFDELIEDREFRHECYIVGAYSGAYVRIYDNEGEGIRTLDHLRDAIEKWKNLYEKEEVTNPYENLKVFIVPADAHF